MKLCIKKNEKTYSRWENTTQGIDGPRLEISKYGQYHSVDLTYRKDEVNNTNNDYSFSGNYNELDKFSSVSTQQNTPPF